VDDAAPHVLLEVIRNGFVESRHRGSLVLLDPSGSPVITAGTPAGPVFPRSSLKPLQATAMVACGFPGRGGALALAAASHEGEDVHIAGVRAVLAGAALDETALGCPADLPAGRDALVAWVRAGGAPAAVCHNCSGKHAAMVATCAVNGWDVVSYLSASHPVQWAIRDVIERLCGEPIAASGVDGCGAPAHAVSLFGLARAFASIATAPAGTDAALVRDAMRAGPLLIGGTGRAASELTAAVDGLLCKDGAEGVWAAALPDGRAFAVKVEDGSARALAPLLTAAIRHWGPECADGGAVVDRWSSVGVLGGGKRVGQISWSPYLRETLGL
jgi:L-asparaginase II